MSYIYKDLRPAIFTEDGSIMFTEVRDRAKRLLREAGAFSMSHVIHGVTGDSWVMLACVDRLVELGEVREVTGLNVRGQDRVFVGAGT